MHFVKDITWENVFSAWRQREASNSGWVDCATRVKGWPDWESWRKHSALQFGAESRSWQLFEFDNPEIEIPEMLVGPYSSWQNKVINKNKTTFAQFLDIPENLQFCEQHVGIVAIMNGLPFATELIGIIRGDNGQLVCFDGHHRAMAISLAPRLGREIDYKNINIKIATTYLDSGEVVKLDEILLRGSSCKN